MNLHVKPSMRPFFFSFSFAFAICPGPLLHCFALSSDCLAVYVSITHSFAHPSSGSFAPPTLHYFTSHPIFHYFYFLFLHHIYYIP